jgi:hypothetical protein
MSSGGWMISRANWRGCASEPDGPSEGVLPVARRPAGTTGPMVARNGAEAQLMDRTAGDEPEFAEESLQGDVRDWLLGRRRLRHGRAGSSLPG